MKGVAANARNRTWVARVRPYRQRELAGLAGAQ